MFEAFTVATFRPRLGETFRLGLPGEAQVVDLVLIEATDLSQRPGGGREGDRPRAPFSLVFRDPGGRHLPQRIYRLEHADLGAFDLFLVPIGPDAQGMRYEAVFA